MRQRYMNTCAHPDPEAVLTSSGRIGEKRDFATILLKYLIQHLMTPDLLYGI